MEGERNRNLREGSEEAARGGRGDFGVVDGGDEEGEADADAGEEAAKHEKRVVRGESHEDCSGEEDDTGERNCVTATYPVGDSAGDERADRRVEVDDTIEDFDLDVGHFEISLYVQSCSTHHSNICSD